MMDQPQDGYTPVDQAEVGPPEQAAGFIPSDQANVQKPENKEETAKDFSTPIQKAATAAEGVARGVSLGISTPVEIGLGLATPEEIKSRQEANPTLSGLSEVAGTVGSMYTGIGPAGTLAKGVKALIPIAKELSVLRTGARLALRGMLEGSVLATGDEASDAFLNKDKSATAVVGHIVSSGALGYLGGGILGAGGAKLEALQNAAYGEHLDNVAAGFGAAAQGPERVESLLSMYTDFGQKVPAGIRKGIELHDALPNQISKNIIPVATGVAGYIHGGLKEGIDLGILSKYLEPVAGKLTSSIGRTISKKVAVPIMLRALETGETVGLTNTLKQGTTAAKGIRMVQDSIDNLFKPGSGKVIDHHISDKDVDDLKENIDNGGINQQIDDMKKQQDEETSQNYAHGGEVAPKPLNPTSNYAKLYPEQDLMMNSTKARVSNYLQSMQPSKYPQKLPFDKDFRPPGVERNYRNALETAINPLNVLNHVKKGTLQINHLKDLNGMYPEVYNHLSEKITKRIVDMQLKGEVPPYRMQQSLSMFLGTSLSNIMTPASIQAAQSVFVPRTAPQQQEQESKPKRSTAPLSKVAKDYQTSDQSRAARANK